MSHSSENEPQASASAGPPDSGGGDASSDENQTTLLGILVFLAIGGGLIYGGVHLQEQMPSSEETVSTKATVLESEFSQRGSGSDRQFAVRVTYEYEMAGETYTSSDVKAGAEGYTVDTRQRAQTLLKEQWVENATITAQVDPEDPETAYLVGYKRGDRLERTLIHYGMAGVGGLMVLASAVSLAKRGRRELSGDSDDWAT
jgi:hypothetical protein